MKTLKKKKKKKSPSPFVCQRPLSLLRSNDNLRRHPWARTGGLFQNQINTPTSWGHKRLCSRRWKCVCREDYVSWALVSLRCRVHRDRAEHYHRNTLSQWEFCALCCWDMKLELKASCVFLSFTQQLHTIRLSINTCHMSYFLFYDLSEKPQTENIHCSGIGL